MEPMILERVYIRRFRKEDWKDLYDYLSDPEVVKFEPYDIFFEEEAKEEASKRAQHKSFYAVCLKENDKLIGNLYLDQSAFDTWELGYVFNRKYQGQGYAIESTRALVDYAFTELGARRIIAMCNPDNHASWKLLEKLHMRREGHLKQNIYFKQDAMGNPLWLDTYLYGILKSEWRN
ncbi:GNAT family protein [Niameybacter massiliensis]|uniref:GNAT family protein n=1 Tax=Holtiella tumoricola TaxID=3018743 RepID=A0AA42DMU1_9FIRM|nr:GNAT family protein [Holtiella tumoricola]MDA3731727.1 GNAT family protein [Holtiella tumoricola]